MKTVKELTSELEMAMEQEKVAEQTWLENYLEDGDITREQYDEAKRIKWHINGEDIILFIWDMESKMPLEDIVKVEYDILPEELEDEYLGVYKVTTISGKVSHYAWKDEPECIVYEVNI